MTKGGAGGGAMLHELYIDLFVCNPPRPTTTSKETPNVAIRNAPDDSNRHDMQLALLGSFPF